MKVFFARNCQVYTNLYCSVQKFRLRVYCYCVTVPSLREGRAPLWLLVSPPFRLIQNIVFWDIA